ncbi:YbjN domain-containing protein [Marihabitans asiaticum]|uniref:Putative sensory transduction regulator n=1 Tax=Marihabitans asiaticum TaxID=415218 RepID=A0A560WH55_9MICO|nr:YbjN domain-containing protein [Marihabitans asiaticum]TWD17002.1 putative sensory transduction regulator [Marihabitans asiaticum]
MNEDTTRVLQLAERYLEEAELEWESGARDGELVVTLPGEKKLKTVASLVVGERDLSVSAFVIRNPDEGHAKVYRYLLQRNLRMPLLGYAVDASGDVYVKGQVPLRGVDDDLLDTVLGVVLEAADQPFNELLVLGFLTSMRKEWDWRVKNGESLRNLEAFRSILERPGDPSAADAS